MIISKKNVQVFTACLLFFLFVGIFAIPAAHAGGTFSDFPKYMLDTINSGVTDSIKSNLSKDSSFYKLMVYDDGGSQTIKIIMGVIYGFAFIRILIMTGVKTAGMLEKGMDFSEVALKVLSSFFLMLFISVNIKSILELVVSAGEVVIDAVSAINSDSEGTNPLTLEMLTGHSSGGLAWWVQSTMILIIPYLFSLAMSVAANFMAFSILLELGIRKIFASYQVMDVVEEGLRSPGVRYLKKYLAAFLKIAIALIVCLLTNDLIISAVQDLLQNAGLFDTLGGCFAYIFQIITINFTMIAFIGKGGEYANDALGV